jgi:hypothetical protein
MNGVQVTGTKFRLLFYTPSGTFSSLVEGLTFFSPKENETVGELKRRETKHLH